MTAIEHYLQAAHTVTDFVDSSNLPPLTPALFATITEIAQTNQFREPNISWALLAVAEDAAQRRHDRQLQAEAAWWLAWGANAYYRPNLAAAALDKAELLFNDTNWQHACLWQRNALPWTRKNYTTAASQLNTAYHHLLRWRPTWARQCQQALAFAYILTNQFSESERHLADNLAHVTGLNRAMGLLIQSSLARRQENFVQAVQLATQARAIFAAESATFGYHRAEEFLAVSYLRQEYFQAAHYHLAKALQGYRQIAIPALEASCHNGIAQIANHTGDFANGAVHLKIARDLFETLGLRGAVADNLVDSGERDVLQGNYREASRKYHAADIIYQEIGSISGWINTRSLEALCQIQLGNLQMALGLLESAENQSNEPKRQAQLAHHLAVVWFYLNQFERTQAYLQAAEQLYKQADQPQSRCKILIQTAILQLQQGQSAHVSLEQAASLVDAHQLTLQRPIVTYLRGVELLHAGNLQQAEGQLQQARPNLVGSDKIRCLQALAACQTDRTQAILWCEEAFRQAKDYPALRWEVCVARAQLAVERAESLKWLRMGLNALLIVQRTFSQPELASSFWQRPTAKLDDAVQLAVEAKQIKLLHEFIEEGKARTFLQQIVNPSRKQVEQSTITTQLAQQQAKIGRLIEQLNRAPDQSSLRALRSAENRYTTLLQKRDRLRTLAASKPTAFVWKQVCATLNQHLSDWIALDYYLLPQAVICVVGTANGKREMVQMGRPDFALTIIADETIEPSQHVMETLGQLIPSTVWERLTPETHLLIAPNRTLHAVSWAGVTRDQTPLAARAIPSVVPSLQTLQALFHRPQRQQGQRGTLLAVEQFGDRYTPLPMVKAEANWLRQSADLHDLSSAKKWSDVLQNSATSLSTDFWHVATHAFFDDVAGWNSGFALPDEDVLLDQMWDAAPLPALMTFAACSGGQRLVLAGDEQIGMPLLCLAAGANSVVAHLRPLVDDYSADLTITFYEAYLSGAAPAVALAHAQRTAWAAGVNSRHWQHAQCFGIP